MEIGGSCCFGTLRSGWCKRVVAVQPGINIWYQTKGRMYSYGLYSYGLYSYGLYSHGLVTVFG